MSAPAPSAATSEQPPPGRVLGDGTVEVAGARGVVRLSVSGTRWWNGRTWEPTATSTPWNALTREDGATWWDGVAWQPVTVRQPWLRRPTQLIALQVGLPVAVLLLAAILGSTGLGILLFILLHGGIYFGMVVSSRTLGAGIRGALFFSAIGLAWVGAVHLLRRRRGDTSDQRGSGGTAATT